jgi:hypothetical protein
MGKNFGRKNWGKLCESLKCYIIINVDHSGTTKISEHGSNMTMVCL